MRKMRIFKIGVKAGSIIASSGLLLFVLIYAIYYFELARLVT